MKLEHFGMAEPGDCRLVFTADAEELERAITAEQAAPDALWDVAYYQGRYYVYFGVIPCLLFQLPFEALTGVRDLPPSLAMILLSWLFLLAAPLLVKQARYVMREMDPVAMRPMLERTVKGALLTNLLFVLGIFLSQWAA